MTFSLSAMIWFSLRNVIVQNKVLPNWLRYTIINHICKLMLIDKYKEKARESFHKRNYQVKKSSNCYENFKDEETNSTNVDSPTIDINQIGKKNLLIKIKHKSSSDNSKYSIIVFDE